MKVARFTVNPYGENTYVIWDDKTHEGAIIDPGMSSQNEIDAVDKYIKDNNINLQRLLITHLHFDHVMGAQHIMDKYGLAPEGAEEENQLGSRLEEQAAMLGVRTKLKPIQLLGNFDDNTTINIGDEKLKVFKIPGHSPGGLVYYAPTSGFIIPGDVIFQQSIGRTDLPGGNYENLISGIKEKVLSLPDETAIYPGHGGATTVGDERLYNGFLK